MQQMFGKDGPTFWELARQALSSTTAGYDLLAPKFDHTPFRTPEPILAAVCRDIEGGAAVDLCCGTGAAFGHLAPRCDRVVGVDLSAGMLDEARRNLASTRTRSGAEVELERADALTWDGDARFDWATCFGAFGHILPQDEPAFVRSVHRALKPGGAFVFASAPMPPRWSAPYLVSKAFNAAMHVRNALLDPPFVMFYLTFMLPDCARLLEANGFTVTTRPADVGDVLGAPAGAFDRLEVVTAVRSPA